MVNPLSPSKDLAVGRETFTERDFGLHGHVDGRVCQEMTRCRGSLTDRGEAMPTWRIDF
jgi:hypothetical protein